MVGQNYLEKMIGHWVCLRVNSHSFLWCAMQNRRMTLISTYMYDETLDEIFTTCLKWVPNFTSSIAGVKTRFVRLDSSSAPKKKSKIQ